MEMNKADEAAKGMLEVLRRNDRGLSAHQMLKDVARVSRETAEQIRRDRESRWIDMRLF